jgi:hypothetical protein
VTGQVQNTERGVLRKEAGTISFETNIARNCIRSREKAERMPQNHPRRLALEESRKPKNARKSWSRRSGEIKQIYNLPMEMESRKEIPFYSREPWCFPSKLTVHSTLDGIRKKDESETAKRAAASTMIKSVSPDITIYTDGSATAGTTNGGAGIAIAGSDPLELDVRSTLMVKGAALTCSYEEENQAMLSACQWIRYNSTPGQKILTMTN